MFFFVFQQEHIITNRNFLHFMVKLFNRKSLIIKVNKKENKHKFKKIAANQI